MQLDFGEVGDSKSVLVVDAEPGKPASVGTRPVTAGTRLVELRGSLEQVLARAPEVEGAYVKVILDEKARAGLNDEVRESIPGAVDVIVSRGEPEGRTTETRRSGRSPVKLFEAYLSSRSVDDPEVVALFRELEQEVVSG